MAEDSEKQNKMSRRQFLRNSGYVAGGAIGGGLIGGLVTNQFQSGAPAQDQQGGQAGQTNSADHTRALTYFSQREDFDILSQATELIFPSDDLGPGAIELGVPYFIDKQLSGAWGHNSKEYMQGPFYEGEPTQGYQSRLPRHEIFAQGIRQIKNYSQSNYDAPFLELEEGQQIEVLEAFEKGEVEIMGAPNELFFGLLRAATIEGAYADPLYSGNQNMDGWRMKEFPGNQMAYINEIESEEFYDEEPQSLRSHME